ncbi:hypothetical protein M407DRAFT_139882 [Tulasnella calospora MUT 4182]|uniref:Uncharacterized protein n=1 Tax=Tulasnella calospora MUT 4182 TaxID=1051891 RepID=A0A0C3KFG8_9AGAM|nr:hypothetical protein M407DRAFT_139882 [Tulasnella calospora MUT 4182]
MANTATNGAGGGSGFQSIRTLGSLVTSGVPLERQKLRKYSWLPDVLRIEGSVIGRIWGPVLTVTIFSVGVAVAEEIYGYEVSLSNNVVPLLSVVVGLLLVFRNGTSYDRYYEGRKDFGSITSTVRNFSRIIWIQVVQPPAPKKDDSHLSAGAPEYVTDVKAEKIYLIKLLLSFVYATVHHLRGETGVDYEDYEGILPEQFTYMSSGASRFLDADTLYNRYAAYSSLGGGIAAQVAVQTRRPSSSGRRLSHSSSTHERQQVMSVPSVAVMSDDEGPAPTNGNADERTPLAPYTAVNIGGTGDSGAAAAYLPLPLVLAHEITKTIYDFKKKGYIEIGGPAGYNTMNTMVNSMVDQLTNLERVATTPIPTSYGIHLKQCVTLYLFALPFTLVSTMHWKMIPLVTLVSFTLMGIEGIADEIEMPFGRDQSDLPLERFCSTLRSEVEFLMGRMPQATEPSPYRAN